MKIAVVGDMNPRQQLVIDKMIADGHEIVYVGKNDPNGGVSMDFCVVDEYTDYKSYTPVKEIKKPYYRVKERY